MRFLSIVFARFFARFFDRNFTFFNHLKNKREVVAWSFYDFANQPFTTIIITFCFGLYFVETICASKEMGDSIWSLGASITAIIVAVCSPLIGAISDSGGFRKFFFILSTWTCIICTACLFFFKEGDIYIALTYVIIANIGFELGSVICNSYLPQIAKKKNIGKISGFAWGLGFIGGLISLIIVLGSLFLSASLFIIPANEYVAMNEGGFIICEGITAEGVDCNVQFKVIESKVYRLSAIIVAIWFAIFSIPAFSLVREKRSEKLTKKHINQSFYSIRNTFSEIKKYKKIVKFLIARIFYNDALVTIFLLGGVYAGKTLGFSLIEILILGIILNIFAGLGSFIFGLLEDKYGPKWCIEISIITLFFAVLLAFFAPFFSSQVLGKAIFWCSSILIGIMTGPSQSCSRSLMARLTPEEKTNEFFGFYAFAGKATAFLGPFFYSLISMGLYKFLDGENKDKLIDPNLEDVLSNIPIIKNQLNIEILSSQAGLLIVVLFFLIGYLLFRSLKFSSNEI